MRKHKTLIAFVFLLFSLVSFSQNISNYKVFFAYGNLKEKKEQVIVIRSFQKTGEACYLAVNPENLKTFIVSKSSLEVHPLNFDSLLIYFQGYAYTNGIKDAWKNSSRNQDAGITHALPEVKGIILTIDLCPSERPLDRTIFLKLMKSLGKVEQPVPIAIAITGKWIKTHQEDLHWLIHLVEQKQITIEWINHSYSHPTSRTLSLTQNFLLEKGTDIQREVIQNEIIMLENKLTPSVFFRFPGLVSDKEIFNKVSSFGIIPVGSDAWLAKNQKPGNGSIVLIHGNGNEPIGVKKFIKIINQEQNNIKNKNWLLFDLRKSIAEKEIYNHN